MTNPFKLASKISKQSKEFIDEDRASGLKIDENNTNLMRHYVLLGAYNTMSLSELELVLKALNRVIQKKKEFIRVQDAKNNSHADNSRSLL